jgi:hypothetical protein
MIDLKEKITALIMPSLGLRAPNNFNKSSGLRLVVEPWFKDYFGTLTMMSTSHP